jgi:2-dehydro-3-deoxyphosphogluconate aldolase/(4S)-4-hydroxy-2-oxoglutarate aldolase
MSIDSSLERRIRRAAVIAVVTIDDPARAVPLANALLEGGVSAIELTLRTSSALESLEAVTKNVPEMLVGAGTVLTTEQLASVRDAGATFAVAPGFNREIVAAADEMGFPFAPGVMTPSEIEGAWSMGCSVLKFYHAGLAGGLAALKSLTGPYAHLGLKFIPLGGVDEANLGAWIADPITLAVGGSWIAPRQEIAAGEFDAITARAAAASAIAAEAIARETGAAASAPPAGKEPTA